MLLRLAREAVGTPEYISYSLLWSAYSFWKRFLHLIVGIPFLDLLAITRISDVLDWRRTTLIESRWNAGITFTVTKNIYFIIDHHRSSSIIIVVESESLFSICWLFREYRIKLISGYVTAIKSILFYSIRFDISGLFY